MTRLMKLIRVGGEDDVPGLLLPGCHARDHLVYPGGPLRCLLAPTDLGLVVAAPLLLAGLLTLEINVGQALQVTGRNSGAGEGLLHLGCGPPHAALDGLVRAFAPSIKAAVSRHPVPVVDWRDPIEVFVGSVDRAGVGQLVLALLVPPSGEGVGLTAMPALFLGIEILLVHRDRGLKRLVDLVHAGRAVATRA